MKTMFKVLVLSLFSLNAFAEHKCEMNFQDRPSKEMIESQKVAFFTKQLELTPMEAEQFWPLYNSYIKERDALHNEFMEKTTSVKKDEKRGGKGYRDFDVSQLSEEEAKLVLDKRLKMYDMDKSFHEELCKILPPKRVLAYYNCERAFHRELLRMMNTGKDSPKKGQRD